METLGAFLSDRALDVVQLLVVIDLLKNIKAFALTLGAWFGVVWMLAGIGLLTLKFGKLQNDSRVSSTQPVLNIPG